MSKSPKFEKICDHRILKEQLYIDETRRILKIPRPIATMNVDLWINGFLIEKTNKVYTWNIENDPTTVDVTDSFKKRHLILFNKPLKALDDFFFVSYTTRPETCIKCQGLRIHNDMVFSKLGNMVFTQNEEKLLQEIKKYVTTHLSTNPFHNWVGTEIHKLIGSKVFNVDLIKARITQEINKCLEKYLDVQIQQSRFQSVTDREALLGLLAVDVVQRDDVDPGYWEVTVIFRNRTGEELIYEQVFNIPGPKNLLYGSNLDTF